jgi:hypothetical protein
MTMVIVYFYILQQNLWINISFDEDTVGNIIHGTIWDLDTQLIFYDISKSSQISGDGYPPTWSYIVNYYWLWSSVPCGGT